MQLWTLYREKPVESVNQPESAEFYSIGIEQVRLNGESRFRIFERHGWWDETERRAINTTTTLQPDEPQPWANAREMFNAQIIYRVRAGFAHLFCIDPFSEKGYTHYVIDPTAPFPPPVGFAY